MLAHTEGLQETLYTEMTGRLKQNDESLPYQRRGYWYYSRYEEGQDYPLICRKQGSLEAEEQIMLNGPEMGAGLAFSLGGSSVSTNNNLLAYSTDTQSRRRYNIEFKDLTTGEKLPDYIENTTGGITWAGDNRPSSAVTRRPCAHTAFTSTCSAPTSIGWWCSRKPTRPSRASYIRPRATIPHSPPNPVHRIPILGRQHVMAVK